VSGQALAMAEVVAGVDGCRGGWLAVLVGPDGPARAQARLFHPAKHVPDMAAVVAIDMPIGLMDRPADGPRPADRAARAFLSDRNADGLRGVGSRVFVAPTRAHLQVLREGGDYAALRARFPRGQAVSKQCYHICGKIIELDDLLAARPDTPLREAHPEIAFAHRAGRTLAPKRSAAGTAQRLDLLRAAGFDPETLAADLAGQRGWAGDDLLDACILALTAGRIAEGRHATLPHPADRDGRGLRMAIHY
jgi:predicted RNase H-like nuclease